MVEKFGSYDHFWKKNKKMFSLLLSTSLSKRPKTSCSELTTVQEKFKCFAETLPPIYKFITNPFISCQFTCQLYSGPDKKKCQHKCNQLDYSSENSQECLLKCSQVSDPINQQQCISNCRSYKRSDYSHDYSDGCSRCKQFVDFVRTFLHRVEDQALSDGLKASCTTQPNLLPICQAIGTHGFDVVLSKLLSDSRAEDICQEINLC